MVPFYCGGFSQWVEFDDWLVKVSWLGKLALVGAWNWISSLWSARECLVVSFEMVCVFGVTLGSLHVDT